MKIEVIHKVIFGQNRFYPANPDADALCDILKTKSLTQEHLKKCKKAGWDVQIITQQFDLGE